VLSVSPPTVNVPMLLPGVRCPPELTKTLPAIEPVPARNAVLLTFTSPLPVPLPVVLFTRSVPALIAVPPL
jgi:hypothetical protein